MGLAIAPEAATAAATRVVKIVLVNILIKRIDFESMQMIVSLANSLV